MLIGNCISFLAACFTLAASVSQDRKRIYLYQAGQCLLLALANVFFDSVSGMTTCALCAVRNCLIAYERFTGRLCAAFVVSVAVIGVLSNNRGVIGLLPVVTTALYTVVCLYAKSTRAIKLNIAVNLSLWAVYDLFIRDYVSLGVDSSSAVAALMSLFRTAKSEKANT